MSETENVLAHEWSWPNASRVQANGGDRLVLRMTSGKPVTPQIAARFEALVNAVTAEIANRAVVEPTDVPLSAEGVPPRKPRPPLPGRHPDRVRG